MAANCKDRVIQAALSYYFEDNRPASLNKYGESSYRGERGLKCSIGLLIDDSIYRRKFEGFRVTSLLDRFPNVRQHLIEKGFYPNDEAEWSDFNFFLEEIQTWHDVTLRNECASAKDKLLAIGCRLHR